MSEWLFDLGNTRLKCAPLRADGQPGTVQALGHAAEQFPAALEGLLPERGRCAYVASVASPALTVALLDALGRHFDRVCMARTLACFAGLHIAYAQPRKLGVDRFLAMLGARHRQAGGAVPDCLVVGVGTAVTIDLVDAAGRHHGGRIAPSPDLMRRALHQAAAQLPAEGGSNVEFASDTEDALASGCLGAVVALVERSLVQAGQRLGQRPRLVLHGGGAGELLEHFPGAVHEPALVLQGLAAWASAVR